MDFNYTDEHIMIRDAARDFAQTELLPGVIERDHKKSHPYHFLHILGLP